MLEKLNYQQMSGSMDTVQMQKKRDSIQVDVHFLQPGHNFNLHENRASNKHLPMQVTNDKTTENFWMQKLGTLIPMGFNIELNFPQ